MWFGLIQLTWMGGRERERGRGEAGSPEDVRKETSGQKLIWRGKKKKKLSRATV